MSVKRIIFWRHGETDANRGMRIQGAIDIPLNALGKRQAAAAAQEIVRLHPSRIYCSDLSRARETAGELAALTDINPIVDPRLQERRYGSWEGLTADQIKEKWEPEWRQWHSGHEPGLDIETREDCGKRMAACVHAAVEQAQQSERSETIVFASHGGAITCAITELLGLNPSHWQGLRVLDNCHWAMLIPRFHANPQWRVVMYNRWKAETADMDYLWEK